MQVHPTSVLFRCGPCARVLDTRATSLQAVDLRLAYVGVHGAVVTSAILGRMYLDFVIFQGHKSCYIAAALAVTHSQWREPLCSLALRSGREPTVPVYRRRAPCAASCWSAIFLAIGSVWEARNTRNATCLSVYIVICEVPGGSLRRRAVRQRQPAVRP